MITVMVTRIRKSARSHLYIKEWMDHRGLGDKQVGERLGVARETVWRWRTQQDRLDLTKLAGLASALDCETEDFWRPPSRPSVDALLKDASDDMRQKAAEVVQILVKTGT